MAKHDGAWYRLSKNKIFKVGLIGCGHISETYFRAEKYFNNKDKKTLIGEFLKVVEIENSKRKKISAKEKKIKEVVVKQVIAEVNVKVEEIRTEKKEKKIKAKLIPEKPAVVLKVGDRVRMKDGKAIGTIEKIEKDKVSVNYGVFISKTNLESLEYVQPS